MPEVSARCCDSAFEPEAGGRPIGILSGADGGLSNGNPAVLEACPKNKRDDLAVAPDPLFDAVGAKVLVVHAPAGVPQERQLTALQPIANGLHVAAGAICHGIPQPPAIVFGHLAADLPVEAEPATVLRGDAGTHTR